MRTVKYGNNSWNISDDNASPEEIRRELMDIFPELETAQYHYEGSDIVFETKAGVKG